MFQTLKLILPALIPSWRFFDVIGPSPRIEFTLLPLTHAQSTWQEFRPKPYPFSFPDMIKALFWNPRGNETLFMISCVERFLNHHDEHSIMQIKDRIIADLKDETGFVRFRLSFICREGHKLKTHVAFISPLYSLTKGANV